MNPLPSFTLRAAARNRILRAFNLGCSLALMPLFTGALGAAVSATLTPATTTSTSTTPVVLQVTGLASGGAVIVERFVDANGNGAVDAGEFLAERFTVTDGQVTSIGGVRNTNIPGDEDGSSNGQLNINLIPALGTELGRLAGQQIIRISSPSAAFTTFTRTLTITQPVQAQSISGTVTAASVALPNASVFLMVNTPNGGDFALGVVADATGHFTVNAPVGSYQIAALKAGYVTNFATAPVVPLTAGATPTQDLQVTAATRSISGKIADVDTGAGLGGVQLFVGTDSGLVAIGSSNADGTYAAAVTAGVWTIEASNFSLNHLGYLSFSSQGGKPTADTTGAPVTGVNINVPKATALIYGTVTNSGSTPLAGILVGANDNNNIYYVDATTDATGHYLLGVIAGSWNANISNDSPGLAGYVVPNGQSLAITAAQAVQVNFAMLSVNAHLQGVVTNTGSPVSAIQVGASNQSTGQFITTLTAANGTFDLGLVAGTWTLQIESSSAAAFNIVSPTVNCALSLNQTSNVPLAVKPATAQITGYVRNAGSQPISGNVYANATISSVNYSANAQTDGSGNYVLPVINGTWQVGVVADGYLYPSQQSATISGSSAIRNFVLQALAPLTITTTQLPNGTVGSSYSTQLSASGGQTPYNWYLPGGTITLPPGTSGDMSFSSDGTNGTISGIPATAGTFYFLVGVTDSAPSQSGVTKMMSLTIDPMVGALNITSQPSNQSVTAGQSTGFTVAATGTPTPGYQWQVSTDGGANWSILVNAGAYSGVSGTTLTVVTSAGFSGYQYRCVVSNGTGSLTSNAATLTVNVPNVAASITSQPSNQAVSAGQSASFTVVAGGTPAPGFQWQVSTDASANWSILANSGTYGGVMRATLTVNTTTGMNGYRYRCVVTNSTGNATSNAATLTVNSPAAGAPVITSQPSNQTLTVGQNANFTTSATGTPTPGYQWWVSTDNGSNWSTLLNGGAYSGVNLSTLTVMPSAGFLGYQYRCVVSNTAGSVNSDTATLITALSAIETWRQLNFGSPSSSGNGADSATPDHDGIANLVKYGLVIAPGASGAKFLPPAQTRSYIEGQRLALIFTRDPARNDITLIVQGSNSPAGPWATLATSTNGASFTGAGYVNETNGSGSLKTVEIRDTINMSAAPSRFMRISVTH